MRTALTLLLGSSFLLTGCVASMAVSAVGAAVRAAAPPPRVETRDLREFARETCRARAAQQGEARIIDAEQASDGRVTVWGTVQDAQARRSFVCSYAGGRVTGFRVREIPTRR